MKRVFSGVLAMAFAAVGLVAGSGVASADVVVGPGKSGSICTGYNYVTGNPKLYWQTCAWADNNEVYFTVNFGNATGSNWVVDFVANDYWKSGRLYECPTHFDNFVVPAHSVKGTPTAACAIPRTRAAYQAVGYVVDGSYAWSDTTDSLQVQ
ncbi:hypothetical protein ACFWNN_26465 [Lentzea sp. NPDC058450]|uniref:hypothetical protein n=1 Tax=Lentzea sp. NPDC058450 TaxID=3346505 RepID=UPI003648FF6C